jgi:hypothetical protein
MSLALDPLSPQRASRVAAARAIDDARGSDPRQGRERIATRRDDPAGAIVITPAAWRRTDEPRESAAFVAQRIAQERPRIAAHVEDWRGATRAYAAAARTAPDAPGADALSLTV